MLNQFRRNINQNWMIIIAIIVFVAFFYFILQYVVGVLRKNSEEEALKLMNNISNETIQNGEQNQTIINKQENASIDVVNAAEKVIKEFVKYCNENQIDKAYDMISENCKKAIFPTINDFKINYKDIIFQNSRIVKIEESMYGDDVFKVTYSNDILSSGGYIEGSVFQDYIRIIRENNKAKLNINKLMDSLNIEKQSVANSIYFKINNIKKYIDYEIYEFNITNNTDKTILLSNQESSDSVCIIDTNQVKYTSNIGAINLEKLIIKPQETVNLNITFNKIYNTSRKSSVIRFSKITLNYEDTKNGKDAQSIEINIEL